MSSQDKLRSVASRERIALFVPSLRGGGAERVALYLAQDFARRGLTVDMVLASAEGAYLEQLPPQVRLVDLRSRRVIRSLPRLARYLSAAQPMGLLSVLGHANLVAILARLLARTPTRLVISEHNPPSIAVRRASVRRARLIPMLARRLYTAADAIVAVSQGVAEDLHRFYKLPRDRIRVIYNPVVTPDLHRKASESVQHPWLQPGAPPLILSVGRLTKPKDFATLLQSFALVRQSLDAHLMILGEGEERPHLERIVCELGLQAYVAMPGFAENPYPYMRHASVFVLSSQWEGFGIVLVEAMACGTPVVSTDCPHGPREILEDGKWGKLVPVGDSAALATAIARTLQSPPNREALRQRAQAFAVDTVAEQYLQVLGWL